MAFFIVVTEALAHPTSVAIPFQAKPLPFHFIYDLSRCFKVGFFPSPIIIVQCSPVGPEEKGQIIERERPFPFFVASFYAGDYSRSLM